MKEFWRKFKKYYLPYPLVYIGKFLIRILLYTCKIEVNGLEHLKKSTAEGKCIIMLWHNRLAILPEIARRYASQYTYRAMISKSRDGELLSILANSYGFVKTLRVPHNAKHQALTKMIDYLKDSSEIIVITPDGPRGPRYQVKSGIAYAAQKTAANIIPVTWAASRFWQLKTWDRLIFPRPFSRIVISFGDPIAPPQNLKENLHVELENLQKKLLKLDRQTYQILDDETLDWPK